MRFQDSGSSRRRRQTLNQISDQSSLSTTGPGQARFNESTVEREHHGFLRGASLTRAASRGGTTSLPLYIYIYIRNITYIYIYI